MTWNSGFKRKEFACKCGCGYSTVDAELLDVLLDVRSHFSKPVIINSACRCEAHNTKVGGARKRKGVRYSGSKHMWGIAADIRVKGVSPDKVAEYLLSKYHTQYGIGRYNSFTHIDVQPGRARRWDNR